MDNKKDYSLYIYYKGEGVPYPNRKASIFGFYESCFEQTYKGSPEDKEAAFKDYMSETLYEKASDIFMFGMHGVDRVKCYEKFLKEYFNPELNAESYEVSSLKLSDEF